MDDSLDILNVKIAEMSQDQKLEFIRLVKEYLQSVESAFSVPE